MRAVTLLGIASVISHSSASLPPPSPVKAMVCIPIERAISAAFTTFLELPEVEIPMRTSPVRPKPST